MSLAALPLLLLFALTLFLSAALLFIMELMIGKSLLPMLGGTPAVWNTCMVFYQAVLLAGYGYAHAATLRLAPSRQAILHLAVMLLPFLSLSLTLDRRLLDYGSSNPIPGLLLGLILGVGLPFFAVSTSAPLLQKWFAGTGHPAARDPYFLYAASNLGSMLGLFGYPLLIEPWLTLADQRLLWRIGYGVLAVLTAGCAMALWRSQHGRSKEWTVRGKAEHVPPLNSSPQASLSILRRLRWIALAFVPSSLMLGATTYMTTDIAAIPLLWVLPLGLYLLSFILVFGRLPAMVHRVMVVLLPILVLALIFLMLSEVPLAIWWKVLLHLAVLFVAAMVCHGELARDRPPTAHLTEFYLWMSVGGVLGGLFNALVAPLLFNALVEYPLALVLACLLTPNLEGEEPRLGPVLSTGLLGLFLGGGLILIVIALGRSDLDPKGLTGRDGFWLMCAVLAVSVVGLLAVHAESGDRAAPWLDLALPLALGVLAVGLNLGLRIRDANRGVMWLYGRFHDLIAMTLPERYADFFAFSPNLLLVLVIFGLPALLCYLFVKRPLRFGLGVAALLLAGAFCDLLDEDVMLRARSFFGALHVSDDDAYRRLEHGTTLHGMQRVRWRREELAAGASAALASRDPFNGAVVLAAGRDTWLNPGREPLTYFHRTGPVGQVFESYKELLVRRPVAVIGLGTGTLASYGQAGQAFTYYEIDPLIKNIAYNANYFTYVVDALERGVDVKVVMGDARLKLEERARTGTLVPAERYALLVIDAFSSDAIPIHLLTREALKIYLDNLADDGLIAFHISNRYLDLEPVLGNLAKDLGLVGFIQTDTEGGVPGKAASNWVVLARRESVLDRLVHEGRFAEWQVERDWPLAQNTMLALLGVPDASGTLPGVGAIGSTLFERLRAPWRRLRVRPEVGVWTDDYSNLLRVFDWKN